MKRKLFIFLLLLQILSNTKVLSQAALSYDILISDIESQVRKGNRRALKDLASLLDKPVYHDQAVYLLEKNTYFTKSEIDIVHCTREQFMRFYFDNDDKIKYSEILHAFYLTPIELQPYTFDVTSLSDNMVEDPTLLLRTYVLDFEKAYKNKASIEEIVGIIKKISSLDIRESYQWLRNTLSNANFNKNAVEIYLALCDGLKNEPTLDNLNIILGLEEKNLVPAELLSASLIELTNYAITPAQTRQLMDSLETFEALRAYGYDNILPFKDFFYEKVDYYAKIMNRKDTPWIQRNALRDMILTQNSRILFYLAAHIRFYSEDRVVYENLLKRLSKTQFSLPTTEGGQLNDKLDYNEKFKNFVRYWANHSDDYEWDDAKRLFVNKNEIAQRTEQYERLFRRLNSENDSAARASFRQLAEGDPSTIAEMTEKYRSLLRNYNRNLPDIRYGYLEQMSRLVSFCKKNHFSFQVSSDIDSLIHILQETRSPQIRYNVENQIIRKSTLSDVTGIEYYGCLYSSSQEVSFSIGRILDFLYSQFWTAITTNDDQTRLFLKKSFLFKKIGVVGICNSYQNKINRMEPNLKEHFTEIAAIESDYDIVNQINVILGGTEDTKVETASKSVLDLFIKDPLSFANGDMRMLPAPNEADYKRLVNKIQSETEKEILRLVMDYMDLHPSLAAVPSLFSIIGDDRKFKTQDNNEAIRVSDRVLILLENIYGHSLKADDKRLAWRKLWQKDGKNYRQWDIQFFEEQVKFVESSPTANIDDILEISKSKHFTAKQKPLVINALKKMVPFSDIRIFKSRLPFKANEDLAYFDTLTIAPKDLDDFVKIFEVENDSLMWRFINTKTQGYTLDDLGSFYNSMFKVDWFLKQVFNEKISIYQKNLAIQTLFDYVTNSELISEFEEQTTQRHIAELQNIGKTLEEKLDASLSLDMAEESKASIQEVILMRISYSQIGKVATYFDRLNKKPGYNPTAFLYKDFGIPIFNPDKEAIDELIKNHQSMKELELYKFYLKRFGVDFLKENDELDFGKIYNILKFEIVTPFTGGGFQRDYFTYGVIKVLELHFKTTLGFHEKLNENQSFYTFSASKRAAKWMQYLENKTLVQPDPAVPASFNRLLFANQ